jgi:hypothetical protein
MDKVPGTAREALADAETVQQLAAYTGNIENMIGTVKGVFLNLCGSVAICVKAAGKTTYGTT